MTKWFWLGSVRVRFGRSARVRFSLGQVLLGDINVSTL